MLLQADGLFRLDVVVDGDTLRAVVRNLSPGALETPDTASGDPGRNLVIGEAAVYEPALSSVEFALGSGSDRLEVKVLIGMLRYRERGTVRVTAQGIIRQAPVS